LRTRRVRTVVPTRDFESRERALPKPPCPRLSVIFFLDKWPSVTGQASFYMLLGCFSTQNTYLSHFYFFRLSIPVVVYHFARRPVLTSLEAMPRTMKGAYTYTRQTCRSSVVDAAQTRETAPPRAHTSRSTMQALDAASSLQPERIY
jgi:hypothetical protein